MYDMEVCGLVYYSGSKAVCETPQHRGQVPQEQGGPVIPPGTGFPFRSERNSTS
jgi:hypothetical protein